MSEEAEGLCCDEPLYTQTTAFGRGEKRTFIEHLLRDQLGPECCVCLHIPTTPERKQ